MAEGEGEGEVVDAGSGIRLERKATGEAGFGVFWWFVLASGRAGGQGGRRAGGHLQSACFLTWAGLGQAGVTGLDWLGLDGRAM
ncbi:Uu.00g099250.m01.CDS01 [Anthostomella pinea]|uniref:Uu.00g099250.m01.CDS01 n=1 Tax=Anthostomella pinea TaxID=933095 RepID=A0AAI8YF43_9PEZI|nr:Uu.00g099250.m01.CDS01 [Anthostomella pinea]